MLPQQHDKITTTGVRGMILARLDTGPSDWIGDLSMRVTSTQASEDYAWLGTSPELREFIGGRTPAELREQSFTITNKDYEGSIKIKSKDMRRDKLGMIQTRVNQLADRALDHPAKLMTTLIEAGESSICYDGQYYFDTDHAEGESGTQSNDITQPVVSSVAPTADEFATALIAGIQQIYGLKDDTGAPMNQSATQFTVKVPVKFMGAALTAVRSILGEGGKSAALQALSADFTIKIAVNARLSWTNKFAIFRTDEAAKAFILQEEDIPDVVALGEGSEYEQLNKEQLYGVDWTGNVGYGYWQYACLVTLTDA